jgi:hypothetical protein
LLEKAQEKLTMQEEIRSQSGSATRFPVVEVALFVVVIAMAAYAFHERNLSKQLAAQNSSITSALNGTRDQVSALSSGLDAMNAERAAEPPAHAPVYHKPMAAAAMRHRVEDPRWKKMQSQLDEQGKQIDATRQDLSSARTELQGSIATTHDELVLLEKKGERNYFEFDLDKTGQFTREGSVGVRLRKANTKHDYADLEMLVDDFKVSKKHVNIYEPVVFYSADSKMPVELVINGISKNHIHGYVSEPKYKGGDLEAMANPSAGNAGTGAASDPNAKPSAAVRQRLQPPSKD